MSARPHGYGLCHCGCGLPTNVARQNRPRFGQVAGKPLRYLRGHRRAAGGRRMDRDGYVVVRMPRHARARRNGYVAEHILVAERALGRPLPTGAVVHHVNEDRSDNRPENLVICQDQSYHRTIHTRTDAATNSGDPNNRKCQLCGEYDSPENLYIGSGPRNRTVRHRRCHADRESHRRNAS